MGGSETMSFPSPSARLTGEGKDMVPETPPRDHVWTGIRVRLSLLCLRSTHLIATQLNRVRIGAPSFCRGAGRGVEMCGFGVGAECGRVRARCAVRCMG
jgi:hypothetical protein